MSQGADRTGRDRSGRPPGPPNHLLGPSASRAEPWQKKITRATRGFFVRSSICPEYKGPEKKTGSPRNLRNSAHVFRLRSEPSHLSCGRKPRRYNHLVLLCRRGSRPQGMAAPGRNPQLLWRPKKRWLFVVAPSGSPGLHKSFSENVLPLRRRFLRRCVSPGGYGLAALSQP